MRVGRRRLWLAGLAVGLAGFGVLAMAREEGVREAPARDAPLGSVARDHAAKRLLARLESALTEGTRREAVRLAGPGHPEARIAMIFDNVQELRLRNLTLGYVDGIGGGKTARWSADVSVTWRIAGFDPTASHVEVPFTFAVSRGRAIVVDVGERAAGGIPLWLTEAVTVARGPRTLVLSADDSVTDRFSTLANRAVRQVGRVLPRWRGRLVVKVPASERGVERVTGADPDEYQGVAAVTTTADGSADPSSPTHVVVNPEVFGRLTPDGAQIVMSHETTHVATAASSSPAPTWLVEGFADYVALAGSDLPVSASAGQIRDQVRSSGPPSRLPGARAFDPSRTAVGASYEAAWLACRMIADRYDERTLVEFYEAVDNGASVETGFRRVLDTDRGAFTSAWRGYLRRLA